MISLLCGLLFRLGGWGKGTNMFPCIPLTCGGNKWFRWIGIGLLISLYTGNWWHTAAYFVATNVFGYGETHPLTKIFGRFNWFISGFMFGLAALSWGNALWCAICFYILMYLSNHGIPTSSKKGANDWLVSGKYKKLSHSFVEFGIGALGTLCFLI